jgi:DNA polymerase-1
MTAATVFGVDPDNVSDEMRFRAKALNFGILYGMGAQGFARSAGISTQEARDFIENYYVQFPKVQEYAEATKQTAQEQGYVETLFGRKRYLPEIHSTMSQFRAAAERMAINHPIQGTLADITKIAMVEIAETMRGEEGLRMLIQIHDELLFEMRDDIIKTFIGTVRTLMERAGALQVPVVVDVKQGANWGEMEKLTS